MPKILIISSLLPTEEIPGKQNENDILLTIEEEIGKRYNDIEFTYLFPLHFWLHDFIRSFFKNRKRFKYIRREYARLKKKKSIQIRGRKVYLIPMISFPYPFFFRNWWRKVYLIRYKKRLDELIKKEKPDLIHAQTAEIDAFLANYIFKKYDLPFIVTMRGLRRGSDYITKINTKSALAYLAMSINQKNLAQKVTQKEILLLPHGINALFFVDASHKVADGHLRLVYIGKLIQRKNIHTIIRAIAETKNVFLDIIGSGEEGEALDRLVDELSLKDQVRFLGRLPQDRIIKLLPDYDIFVMVSKNETLGRVYFEAMAAGLPVIASKNTGVDGIVTDGKEGFLLTPGSVPELTKILQRVVHQPDLLNEMSKNAKKLASKYTWDQVCKQYYDLYTKFLQ